VFVTNFPLPVRDRQTLAGPSHAAAPGLIYASFTAYGEAGEEAEKTGFDSTAYWARTGLMDQVRAQPSTPPARSMPGMGDHPSATGLSAAIVTALYRRERTGQGGVVPSLLQNGLWANACAVQTRLFGERVAPAPRGGAERPGQPLSNPTAAGSSWRCSTNNGSCPDSCPPSVART
jgi:formyl-CoA transferase